MKGKPRQSAGPQVMVSGEGRRHLVMPSEVRSQGPLIAFIDLMFLVVAFLVLLLFFIQQQHPTAEQSRKMAQERQMVQEQAQELAKARTAVEHMAKQLEPYMAQLEKIKHEDTEKRRAALAREQRRNLKSSLRVEYLVTPQGQILYQDRQYSVAAFLRQVITPARRKHWLGLVASVAPEVPFGTVVAIRRELLQNRGEFDTYWDNLTPKERPTSEP